MYRTLSTNQFIECIIIIIFENHPLVQGKTTGGKVGGMSHTNAQSWLEGSLQVPT